MGRKTMRRKTMRRKTFRRKVMRSKKTMVRKKTRKNSIRFIRKKSNSYRKHRKQRKQRKIGGGSANKLHDLGNEILNHILAAYTKDAPDFSLKRHLEETLTNMTNENKKDLDIQLNELFDGGNNQEEIIKLYNEFIEGKHVGKLKTFQDLQGQKGGKPRIPANARTQCGICLEEWSPTVVVSQYSCSSCPNKFCRKCEIGLMRTECVVRMMPGDEELTTYRGKGFKCPFCRQLRRCTDWVPGQEERNEQHTGPTEEVMVEARRLQREYMDGSHVVNPPDPGSEVWRAEENAATRRARLKTALTVIVGVGVGTGVGAALYIVSPVTLGILVGVGLLYMKARVEALETAARTRLV